VILGAIVYVAAGLVTGLVCAIEIDEWPPVRVLVFLAAAALWPLLWAWVFGCQFWESRP
jgi:hypothetical protein